MISFGRDLIKHGREFARYLRTGKYEYTPNGILFPRAGVVATGVYEHDVNGQDVRRDPNLVVNEGMHYLLDVGLNNGTKIATWYLGLYSSNSSPVATNLGTDWNSYVEVTAYAEATRVAFTPSSFDAGETEISNSGSKATFTANGTSTVWGCVLVQQQNKNSYTGKLLSQSTFGSARSLVNTDVFNLGYTIDLA